MPDDFIRSRGCCQMCSLVPALSASLFSGWLPETLWGRLFKAIAGWRFGTIFGIFVKLFLQFLYGLIELGNQLSLSSGCC